MTCDADRNPPRKAYFEFDDHPESTIPYAPREDIAKRKRIPTLISAITKPSKKGSTERDDRAATKKITGAR
jgi:hypothetical protein